MADAAPNIEDLEDGEIESGDEEVTENQNEDKKEDIIKSEDLLPLEKIENQEIYYQKPGKKKKKSKKSKEQKFKDKHNSNRKFNNTNEDDFAGHIEKAIRKALNKNDNGEPYFDDDADDRRKYKKRKKYDGKDGPGKKRKKQEYPDEMDESEMMCVRGASPVAKQELDEMYPDDDRDSYTSESSEESRGHQNHRNQRHRPPQRERNKNNNKNDRRRGVHPMQDPDGVCLYFMQGKCHKGDDCIYSHDAKPPRKMELCKFYLMDCCAKRDKCLYMHADFPCKYYHTGLPCIYKDECKFAHGKPLTDNIKNILLKHIESAPKEILGDFPRLNREGAMKMIQNTQSKLMQQFSECSENQDNNIPSLFELNVPNLPNSAESMQNNVLNNDRQNKFSPKIRQSRWQNDNLNQTNYNNMNLSPNSSYTNTTNVLSIKNLTGVLTSRQISDLSKMGIENLDQLGQLTVLQLNNIGLSLKQITEIQLNTMSIQKLGLINSNNEQHSQSQTFGPGSKDLDLRVPPGLAVTNALPVSSDLPGQDVDMRFQPVAGLSSEDSSHSKPIHRDQQTNKDLIDIDQYTKDALKFVSKDKENIDISNEGFENEKPKVSNEIKDIDHRILPFSEDSLIPIEPINVSQIKQECDTDIRFLQPEPIFKNPEKRHRRSTTDDEDNNLLIDEKWYSSDEEKGNKIKKSPASSPVQTLLSPPPPVPVIEPSAVLSRLGDLSKIDISEEVTKLLNTMKNNLNDIKQESSESNDSQKPKDPRRASLDKLTESPKPHSHKRPPRVSIYECVDGEPTDGRRRLDVDLRKTDFNVSEFGDTDLRTSTSGDIDFRLGLPFKAIPNYTPASEIDGSINSHPPITYKLALINIPRPDYTDIRNSTAKSQALSDPRLRKVFRLSVEESSSDNEKPPKATTTAGPRVDPRRKPKDSVEVPTQDVITNSLDLQTILQNSNWYKDLSSTQKIFVSQHLTPVTQMIKQHHQEKIPGKKFDLSSVQNNSILCNIFTNLGISLGETGEFSYLPKPKEALLKTPANFNQNPFNMSGPSGPMDSGNMNLMNMAPMGMGGMNNMNMGNMHSFSSPMPDPRGGPTPGLLGIAPNIPHNFNNFGGPNNFGNMPFNGPGGNDFNFMENEQNFPRFPNRGGHRGRGNERWNRGGRGNRNQKNFNDRGNWKHDRS